MASSGWHLPAPRPAIITTALTLASVCLVQLAFRLGGRRSAKKAVGMSGPVHVGEVAPPVDPVHAAMLQEARVHVVADAATGEALLSELYMKYPTNPVLVVGFDVEWRSPDGKLAVLQLTFEGVVLVFQVHLFREDLGARSTLAKLLRDPAVLKVGVGIQQDAKRCLADLGLTVTGCVDLVPLLQRAPLPNTSRSDMVFGMGLGAVVLATLGVDFKVPPQDGSKDGVRCGDWEVHILTQEQVLYAAADSFYARKAFLRLFELRQGTHPALQWSAPELRGWCQGLVDTVTAKKSKGGAGISKATAKAEGKNDNKKKPKSEKGDEAPGKDKEKEVWSQDLVSSQGVVAAILRAQHAASIMATCEGRVVPAPHCALTEGNGHVIRCSGELAGGEAIDIFAGATTAGRWRDSWKTPRAEEHWVEYRPVAPLRAVAYSLRATSEHSCRGTMPRAWDLSAQRADGSWLLLHTVDNIYVWQFHPGFADGEIPGKVRYFEIPGWDPEWEELSKHRWEWQATPESKGWGPFTEEGSRRTEQRYLQHLAQPELYPPTLEVTARVQAQRGFRWKTRIYEVDVDRLVQVRAGGSGFERAIRRVPTTPVERGLLLEKWQQARGEVGTNSQSDGAADETFTAFRWTFRKPAAEKAGPFAMAVAQIELFGRADTLLSTAVDVTSSRTSVEN